MSLLTLGLGTWLNWTLAFFCFMMVAFGIPGDRSLPPLAVAYLNTSMIAYPALSVLLGSLPWGGYFFKWPTLSFWWFVSPIPLMAIHFLLVQKFRILE